MEPPPESASTCASSPTPDRRKGVFSLAMTVLFTAFTTVILMAITLWYLDVDVPDALDDAVNVGYSILYTVNIPRAVEDAAEPK